MDQADWHQARARALFARIADMHGLRNRGADQGPDYFEVELPVQYGLRIALRLAWARDTLSIRCDLFTADFYLDADPEAEFRFVETIDGLVTGEVRALLFYWPRGKRPYKALLQRAEGAGEDAEWRTFYTWFRWLPWSPLAREEVFLNAPAMHLRVVGTA